MKTHTKPPRPVRRPVSAFEIDRQRATEIQTALINSGYLSGVPSGAWNGETQAAMQKYQEDNGWQTKITPDSRAIIKLGLGSSTTPSLLPNVQSTTVGDARVSDTIQATSAADDSTQ